MLSAFGMMHCNKLCTRGDSPLDLCFTNNPACIANTYTVPPQSNANQDGILAAAHTLFAQYSSLFW